MKENEQYYCYNNFKTSNKFIYVTKNFRELFIESVVFSQMDKINFIELIHIYLT